MDHFINPKETYRRNFQILPTYVQESATYLHLQTGRPLAECVEYVRQVTGPGGEHEIKVPEALVLVRGKNGDRSLTTQPFDQYLGNVFDNDEVLSPTMAAYVSPDKKVSVLAQYIDGNLTLRKKAKAAKFEATMRGDKLAEAVQESMQSTYKIKNNSLSGAHSSPHTILWNKSSHSTLTSTCRVVTSYGNANNEKFLYGNRHYWSPDVVKTNLISIINHTNYPALESAMQRYGIREPSVEEVMACINRCTEYYWRSPHHMGLIRTMVERISPLQRAAFLYTSDFYHLTQCNPEFSRKFITDLITKPAAPLSMEDAKHWIGQMDTSLHEYVSMLRAKELRGEAFKEAANRPEDYGWIGATAKHVIEQLDHYRDFIRTFWVTDNLPPSIYYLPNIIRRGVITSDTDSTIFTVQDWTEWYVGKLDFSEESLAVGATMVYLATELVKHILATASGNMGVAQKDIRRLSMKNEYYMPVFSLTSRAKHYYAYISAQEGNVFKKFKLDVKGVALRNSNVPPDITAKAHALIREIMDTVMAGKKLSIYKVLNDIAELENGIRKDVESGGYGLLPRMQIKGANSYKNPESSNFVYYAMWEEVFATKYGHAPLPPYGAIKVSIEADNPTKLKAWLDAIEDRRIADNLQGWLERNQKKGVTTLLLPEPILAMSGVPPEVIKAVDVRSLIFQTMEAFYLILESLGIFMRNDNITRLVSDRQWGELVPGLSSATE